MATESSAERRIDGGFLRARLASFLAVMPLGVWTVAHLWSNLSVFRGPAAWEEDVTHFSHPVAHFATMVLALVPLALHTVWGVRRLASSRPNNLRYRSFANLKYAIQRLSAIGVLLFLGAHVFKAMIEPRLVHGHAETFADISTQMGHHPPTLAVYLLGTLGVAYHLGNGLQTFAMGWGLTTSRRALARFEILSYATFILVLGMSWGVIWAMWRAGQ
jgi:succinate dehydrogenase / fumarate reductase cytochrome b subunit